METTTLLMGYISIYTGVILGIYWDNGKENGPTIIKLYITGPTILHQSISY